MNKDTSDILDMLYSKEPKKNNSLQKISKKNLKAKYEIFDEEEFNRGRQILGNLIVHGMMASGGTDLDWLIEHNGGFVILEFKGFHNDKVNIPRGQMIAYENLHEKLNIVTKCFLYIVGYDDIDFLNPDSKVWIFEMNQWKQDCIPKNVSDIYEENVNTKNKFVIYREYFEEISVEKLRELVDQHWKEFELSTK